MRHLWLALALVMTASCNSFSRPTPGLGTPCASDAECGDGTCQSAPTGSVCTRPCGAGVECPSGLAGGTDERGLAGGADERGLAGGAEKRGLTGGADERGLAGGADERGLAGGADEHGLAGGAMDRRLESGAAERAQWQLRKRVTPEAIATDVAEFTLTFVNDGTSPVERLVMFDRVDPALRVESAPAARAFVLDDGSTLLVWDDRAALPPRRQRSVSFTAVLRAEPGET